MNCMTSALSQPFSATFLNKWFKAKSNIWWTFVTRGAREMWGNSPQKMQNKILARSILLCIAKGRATSVCKWEGKMYLNPEADSPQTVPGIETLWAPTNWLTRPKVIWCFWAWARSAVNNTWLQIKENLGFSANSPAICLVSVSRTSTAQLDLISIILNLQH